MTFGLRLVFASPTPARAPARGLVVAAPGRLCARHVAAQVARGLLPANIGDEAIDGVAAARVGFGTAMMPLTLVVEPGMAFSTSCANGPTRVGPPPLYWKLLIGTPVIGSLPIGLMFFFTFLSDIL